MSSSTFAKWCEMTCFHGVHDFYLVQNRTLKLLWLCVIVIGCFLAVNQSVDFILGYALEDHWITNVYQISPPGDRMQWPDLTVCYSNHFDAPSWRDAKSDDAGMDPYEIAYLSEKEAGVDFYHKYVAREPVVDLARKLADVRRKILGKAHLYEEPWRHLCREAAVHCSTNKGFTSRVYCDCDRYGLPSTMPGCFVMNLTAIRSTSNDLYSPGYESGVQVLLDPGASDYYENILYGDKLSAAFNLYIHYNGEENDKYSKPILAGSGMHVMISMAVELHRTTVRRTYTFRFHTPKPPCVSKFAYNWLNTSHSSRTLCRQDCFTEFAMESCRCISIRSSVPLNIDMIRCNETEEEICQLEIGASRASQTALATGFNLTDCLNQCRDPCEHLSVAADVSTAPFPVARRLDPFADYLRKASIVPRNFSRDRVAQYVLIELFFTSKEYKVLERVIRVSLEDLISSIGGTLGVWTGLSLIGIFQALVYLIYGLNRRFGRHFGDLTRVSPEYPTKPQCQSHPS